MSSHFKYVVRGLALASVVALPSIAVAQPLNLTVNPFAIPGAIIRAPFAAFSPPPANVYNPVPAYEAAVGFTPQQYAIVSPPVLRATGPRYDNPANADPRQAIVIRRGAFVPEYINTAPVENISVPGLAPNGRYAFFVSPEQKIVVLDSASRQVVRILR